MARTRPCTRRASTHSTFRVLVGWQLRTWCLGKRLEGLDGTFATVATNVDEPHPDGVAVYNFQVDFDHTYFVSEGGIGCGSIMLIPSIILRPISPRRILPSFRNSLSRVTWIFRTLGTAS